MKAPTITLRVKLSAALRILVALVRQDPFLLGLVSGAALSLAVSIGVALAVR